MKQPYLATVITELKQIWEALSAKKPITLLQPQLV